MNFLVLIRHGESRWNLSNRFTGWVDVPLSEKGIYDALSSAEQISGVNFDVAFTSKLRRAQETLLILLAKQERTGVFLHESGKKKLWSEKGTGIGKTELPIYSHEALNERCYGDLQGMNKDVARKKWGKEQVFKWRRSWDIPPPNGESLKDTYNRVVPYFKKHILPLVKQKKNVVVSAHGNSLRAIIKFMDGLSEEDIPHLELPTAKPLIYEYTRGKLIRDDDHTFSRPIIWVPKKRRR